MFAGVLAGISVAFEGVDLALTLNDVLEGDYTTAVAALPFISHAMVSGGKVAIRNSAGKTLGQYSQVQCNALSSALSQPTWAGRSAAVHQLGLSHPDILVLVRGGSYETNPVAGSSERT